MAVQGLIDKERTGLEEEVPVAPPEPQTPPAPELAPDTKAQLDELKAQLEAEKQARAREAEARAAAEQEAQTQRQAVATHQQSAYDAQATAIERALEASVGKLQALRTAYAAAAQNADATQMADLMEQMSYEAARKLQLEGGKAQIEQVRKTAAEAPAQADPLAQFTPRTRDYVRKHPELLNDRSRGYRAAAAHNEALAEGFVQDTDAYFDYMDQKLGYKQQPAQQQAPAASGPNYAAPPSRPDTGPRRATKPNELTMTPHMRELAKMAGMTDAEWAKEYLASVEAGEVQPIH